VRASAGGRRSAQLRCAIPLLRCGVMVFITQLTYVRVGRESVFEEFEAQAIPLIAKHGGELLLRLRPTPETVVACAIDVPYEIHLVSFPSEEAFSRFASDGARQQFLHLKEDSVRESLLVRGTTMSASGS
jgi:uncharacterized protein (DUF1330 family)